MSTTIYSALIPRWADGDQNISSSTNFETMDYPNPSSRDKIPYNPFRFVMTQNPEDLNYWVNPVFQVTHQYRGINLTEETKKNYYKQYKNDLIQKYQFVIRNKTTNGTGLSFANIDQFKIEQIIHLAVKTENMYHEEQSVGRSNPAGRKAFFAEKLQVIMAAQPPYRNWFWWTDDITERGFRPAGRGRGTRRHHRGKKAKQTHRKKLSKRRR